MNREHLNKAMRTLDRTSEVMAKDGSLNEDLENDIQETWVNVQMRRLTLNENMQIQCCYPFVQKKFLHFPTRPPAVLR
ncbi:MAG: hypothetical protein QF879_06590, partial [Candidatus Latescibacteria bacterium]|nr:hypothetical protein [Candidatus Latescibacterota bacterium]